MTNIFAGARAKSVGIPFKLPKSGIEGKALGISGGDLIDVLKGFTTKEQMERLKGGDFQAIIEPGTMSFGVILARCSGQDDEEAAARSILYELHIADQRALTEACFEASFGSEGVSDFFGDWAKSLGIDVAALRASMAAPAEAQTFLAPEIEEGPEDPDEDLPVYSSTNGATSTSSPSPSETTPSTSSSDSTQSN